MDIKDFILIGGGLLIAAVIAHGFLIAWRARREPLRLDIVRDIATDNVDDIDRLRGELPNGGARVVARDLVGEQAAFELETAPRVLEPTITPAAVDTTRPSDSEKVLSEEIVLTEEIILSEEVVVSESVSDKAEPERRFSEQTVRARRPAARKDVEPAADPLPEQPPVEELVVINILASGTDQFTGDALFAVLRGKGLKFGDMNIFHRVDPNSRRISYSVANVVEPGTFDMADMEAFRSPGLCFFLQLPGPENPSRVFEEMVNISRDVATELKGELKDEQRNFMTPQTVEHYRQRIADFSRRRMSKRA